MNNVTVDPSFIIDLKLSRIVEIVAAMFYGHVSLATSRTETRENLFLSCEKNLFRSCWIHLCDSTTSIFFVL
jgi:hypothetical protein